MLVRTQRRRISPRTRRRYLAIRGFFKKALDNCTISSQFFTKCGSTVFNNHVNKKIFDLEERLNALDNASIDQLSAIEKSKAEVAYNATENNELTKELETEVLYKTSENRYKGCSSRPSLNYSELGDTGSHRKNDLMNMTKSRNKKTKDLKKYMESQFYSSEHAYMAQNYSVYFEENKQHIRKNRTKKHCSDHQRKHSKQVVSEIDEEGNRLAKHNRNHVKRSKLTKQTSAYMNYEGNLNQNYIAEIIQKQYEPIDVVDRRVSETSQFSVPICRDHLSLENTSLVPNEEFIDCLNDNNNKICKDSVIYDPTIKHKRYRKSEPKNVTQNDFELYDFIPVKEMSTPKSRRKFVEEQMIANSLHKEVPPSPRTNRPRLNLTVKHYTEYDDCDNVTNDNNETNEEIVAREDSEGRLILKDEATLAEDSAKENTLLSHDHNLHENENSEKPNTTLLEIKETLQQFLQEVKNENSIYGMSDRNHQGNDGYAASNTGLPMFNSCYYPVVPICPVNYMQSAFVPSTSTCVACTRSNDSEGTVAEQLIKQIHQGATPDLYNNKYPNHANHTNVVTHHKIPLTSRSAGSGTVLNCCDVNVQIPTLNCISNSSATIGSKIISKGCDIGTKERFSDLDLEEINVKSRPVVAENAIPCGKNDTFLQNESSRWKKFFKSFGTVKKCASRKDSSLQLPNEKFLHNSPRMIFDHNLLSRKTSNDLVVDMSPYVYNSHYPNKFYLKEVQVKCVATQSERPRRYLFGLFSKRQSDKIMYPSKGIQDNATWWKHGCS